MVAAGAAPGIRRSPLDRAIRPLYEPGFTRMVFKRGLQAEFRGEYAKISLMNRLTPIAKCSPLLSGPLFSLLFSLLCSPLCGAAQAAPESFAIDPGHTFPQFEVRHLGIATQRGSGKRMQPKPDTLSATLRVTPRKRNSPSTRTGLPPSKCIAVAL